MKANQILISFLLLIFGLSSEFFGADGLSQNFYKPTCPLAETIVRDATFAKVKANPSLGAKILRLHYHDCFVRGCDASILLDKIGTDPSEKDARPNLSLGGFDEIDDIKAAVEAKCPGVVSCADVLALAARDAVSFPFRRPLWNVLTGRRDGKTTLSSDVTGNLPSPFSDFTTLKNLFAGKGLLVPDLVALSGAHTIGVSHCGAFSRRIFNFSATSDVDPTLDPVYAAELKQKCPLPTNAATTVEMDPRSSLSFDTSYFNILTKNKGLFQSDAALLNDTASAAIVRQLQIPAKFFAQFAKSMINMGNIQVLSGLDGEIREKCRFVNPPRPPPA